VKFDPVWLRLRNQKLARPELRRPEDVVAWLGAVQSQDYPGAKWGLGLRMKGFTDADVDRAFDDGRILRTHILRPTRHFVAHADIRWMLALSGPRVNATNAHYYRKVGLDDRTLSRCLTALQRALEGGKSLTRQELRSVLEKAGLQSAGMRLAYVVMRAELDGVVCSGPRRGKQFTYALLDERVPRARSLDRDEALAALAGRYFSSHGPATLRDYVWWSGLTTKDARAGIEMAKPTLVQEDLNGLTYWHAPSQSLVRRISSSIHLLPNYDEYLIAYKDRGAIAAALPSPKVFDAYGHFFIVEGRFMGTWRRAIGPTRASVTVSPFRALSRSERRDLDAQVARYGKFLNLPVTLSFA
jgi:DNA glycosylase AlkZ-like